MEFSSYVLYVQASLNPFLTLMIYSTTSDTNRELTMNPQRAHKLIETALANYMLTLSINQSLYLAKLITKEDLQKLSMGAKRIYSLNVDEINLLCDITEMN